MASTIARAARLALLAACGACSGSQPAAQAGDAPPDPTGQAAGDSAPSEAGASSGDASPASNAARQSAYDKRMAAARTVEDCQAIGKDAIYDPKGDTSAIAAGDGQSKRLEPMIKFMREHRAGFRCCFDIWADKIPEARLYVQVTFNLSLDPKGNLQKAEVTRTDKDPYVAEEVAKCLVSVANELKYPPSVDDMLTDYNHRFDFKPRRRK